MIQGDRPQLLAHRLGLRYSKQQINPAGDRPQGFLVLQS